MARFVRIVSPLGAGTDWGRETAETMTVKSCPRTRPSAGTADHGPTPGAARLGDESRRVDDDRGGSLSMPSGEAEKASTTARGGSAVAPLNPRG
jgi:hypothetical protein